MQETYRCSFFSFLLQLKDLISGNMKISKKCQTCGGVQHHFLKTRAR